MILGRRHLKRGFTLIEALVAIAVMVILIPVLLEGFNISGSVAESTRRTADATALAQSTMDELIATRQWQNSGGMGGMERMGVTDYQWDSQLSTWDDPTVQLLTVTVHWTGRTGPQQIALMSLVYVPGSATQNGSVLGTGGLGGLGGGIP